MYTSTACTLYSRASVFFLPLPTEQAKRGGVYPRAHTRHMYMWVFGFFLSENVGRSPRLQENDAEAHLGHGAERHVPASATSTATTTTKATSTAAATSTTSATAATSTITSTFAITATSTTSATAATSTKSCNDCAVKPTRCRTRTIQDPIRSAHDGGQSWLTLPHNHCNVGPVYSAGTAHLLFRPASSNCWCADCGARHPCADLVRCGARPLHL